MKEMTLDLKTRLISMLNYIDNICEKNHIHYYLAGGTLLGAVRHQGFIPWDDDLDLSLPRPDYNRLIKIIESTESEYRICSVMNEASYDHAFVKLVDTSTEMYNESGKKLPYGAFIDLFPIDGYGNNYDLAVKRIKKINKYLGPILNASIPFEEIEGWVGKAKLGIKKVIFSNRFRLYLFHRIEQSLESTDFYASKYIGSTYGLRAAKEIIDGETFRNTIRLPFEGKSYPCPSGYDQYLRQMYGDYMKLPPKEQQVNPHNYQLVIKRNEN